MITWAKTESITLQEILIFIFWHNIKMIILGLVMVCSRDIVHFLPGLAYRFVRYYFRITGFVENKIAKQ
jgi:hypothetical protein